MCRLTSMPTMGTVTKSSKILHERKSTPEIMAGGGRWKSGGRAGGQSSRRSARWCRATSEAVARRERVEA